MAFEDNPRDRVDGPSEDEISVDAEPAFRSDEKAHREGLALLRRLHGAHSGEQLVASLQDVCPDFADMTIEWAIHGVMSRPGLDLVTRELLLIAACTTLGFAAPQLRAHIEGALAAGATRRQIVETILQMTFYAGGAATSNAMRLAGEVLGEQTEPVHAARASGAGEDTTLGAATPTSLAQVSDRCAVIDSLYRFGAGQDLHDEALFASAFTENAGLDFRQPASRLGTVMPLLQGRSQIVETVMSAVSRLDTTHTVTNPRVSLDGDAAELIALVEAYHLPRDDHSRHLQLKNIFRVSARRGAGDWRIDRMRIDNVWLSGDPSVLFGSTESQVML